MTENSVSRLDPITFQVQWSRLISIMEEVDVALVRTSFSTIVGETRDFAVVMLDRNAYSIAQSEMSSPAFTCSLPAATRTILKIFPAETLQPGDVLITNDPWLCHGHLPDFYIILPVFADGELCAYIATAAHVSDVGGRLDEFDARDVYEEGLRIPPSKLYSAGQRNEQLFGIMEANIRYPRQVLGDVEAIVGASRLGAQRYLALFQDYGKAALDLLADNILQRSSEAMADAIRNIPDGTYSHEVHGDGYKQPVHIKVAIQVEGDRIAFDYTGSSPQRSDASINCVLNVTQAHSIYAVKCSLAPEIPNNEGLFSPISVHAPEGSILNARFPAAVKARSKTSFYLHNAIYGALVDVLPTKVQAASGSFFSIKCYGVDKDGERFAVHMLPSGGRGAVNGMDGSATTPFPTNGMLTPVEVIENRAPMLILERSLRDGSGGRGRFRGGLGQTLRFAPLGDQTLTMTFRPDKVVYPAEGLAGGCSGMAGAVLLNGAPIEPNLVNLGPGSELTVKLPGGGGYGDPARRDPELERQHRQLGFVTDAILPAAAEGSV